MQKVGLKDTLKQATARRFKTILADPAYVVENIEVFEKFAADSQSDMERLRKYVASQPKNETNKEMLFTQKSLIT